MSFKLIGNFRKYPDFHIPEYSLDGKQWKFYCMICYIDHFWWHKQDLKQILKFILVILK